MAKRKSLPFLLKPTYLIIYLLIISVAVLFLTHTKYTLPITENDYRKLSAVPFDWTVYTSDDIAFSYPREYTLVVRESGLTLSPGTNISNTPLLSITPRNDMSFVSVVEKTKSNYMDVKTEEIRNGVKISGKVHLSNDVQGGLVPVHHVIIRDKFGAIDVMTQSVEPDEIELFHKIASTIILNK